MSFLGPPYYLYSNHKECNSNISTSTRSLVTLARKEPEPGSGKKQNNNATVGKAPACNCSL